LRIVLDCETDGLLHEVTTVWCIAVMDVDTENVTTFSPCHQGLDLSDFNSWLVQNHVVEIIGHNIIGYDVPVLERLLGVDFSKVGVIDTLVLSRLYDPTRQSHSLKSWGIELNKHKGDYNDWSKFTGEMLEYCVNDIRVTLAMYKVFDTEDNSLSTESVALEHRTAGAIGRQTRRGWLLDERKSMVLVAELQSEIVNVTAKVRETFKPLPVFVPLNHPGQKKLNKDGSISARYQKQLDLGAEWVDDVWGYYDYPEFNLGSRQQIGRYLQHFGWKPKETTETGLPVVNEKTLGEITDIPEAELINNYLMLQKRYAQVTSWLKALSNDGRIRGYVNPCGTVTGRMTHSKPNLAQVPAVYSPYGKECRSLFVVPKGYKLVGMDASGLELRMLAHYMNDKDYTYEVLNGDIHTANQRAAGLESRDKAKTFIYAFLYGAGDGKIGEIVGGTARQGKVLKANFLNNTPALATLRSRVAKASGKGYLKGLDGRRIKVRSEHSALNTLLQGAGAVVMKQALVHLEDYANKEGLDYNFIGNIHDEIQTEVREDQATRFGELAVQAVVDTTETLNLRCPLDAEYKIGNNWADTH